MAKRNPAAEADASALVLAGDVDRGARWASLIDPRDEAESDSRKDEDPASVLEMEAQNRTLVGIKPGSFDDLLDSLSSAEQLRMRDAFRTVEHGLRDRAFSDRRQRRLLKELAECAQHRSWVVRRAVAHALQFFPNDSTVDPLLGELLADDNDCVAKEAQRTKRLRIERSLLRQLPLPVDDRMQEELLELETKYNRGTRDAAVRLGLWYAEFMVNAMNHQLKTAMSPVGVALETLSVLLREREGLDEEQDWVRSARTHFGQAAAVLKHSVSYVRRAPPRYEPTDLRELVETAAHTLRKLPLVTEARTPLEVGIDMAEKLEIDAVGDLLHEALVNVMKNAVEASTARHPIRLWITAQCDKRDVTLAVRDEGGGMTAEQCAHDIWRPFGSKKEGGTGLGMPLARKIVEVDHRGHIEVTSAKDVGTTVTMRLPISQRF
jgi:signal transduction histidine kinase